MQNFLTKEKPVNEKAHMSLNFLFYAIIITITIITITVIIIKLSHKYVLYGHKNPSSNVFILLRFMDYFDRDENIYSMSKEVFH